MQAEDLNVAFPLSYWVTRAFTPPATGDKNLGGEIPGELIKLDDTHVMWPRNTEYEIFTVGGARHTLGAVFVLGHKSVFTEGVPPVTAVAERARAEGALLDMDKHDWPWAMALPSLMGVKLYELANNHIWRTQFGFTNWSTPAPPHLRPPYGGNSGGEREWIHYTLGNYYALQCGFTSPTAGAPMASIRAAEFGRVYVHLPGFSYEAWKRGLDAGAAASPPPILRRVNRDPARCFRPGGFKLPLPGERVIYHRRTDSQRRRGSSLRFRADGRRRQRGALTRKSRSTTAGWPCGAGRIVGGRPLRAHRTWHGDCGKPLAPAADRDHLITMRRLNLPPRSCRRDNRSIEKPLASYGVSPCATCDRRSP